MQILPVFSSQIVLGGVGWFVFRELRFGVVITVLVYFFFFKQKLKIHECVLYPLERKTNKKNQRSSLWNILCSLKSSGRMNLLPSGQNYV